MFRLRTAQKKFRNVAFSPSALFQTGDILLWYDPSDLTTMFRDTAGTQPVTADGDSVALMLDKGQWGGKTLEQVRAAALEKLSSGTIQTLLSPGSTATFNTATGVGTVYRDASGYSGINFAVAGYVAVDITSDSTALALRNAEQSGVILKTVSVGRNTYIVGPVSSLSLSMSANSSANITVHSVKEIPGYHRTQATGTSMPKYKTGPNPVAAANSPELVTNGDASNGTTGWSAVNGTLTNVSNRFSLATSANFGFITQEFSITGVRSWRIRFDVVSISGGEGVINVYNTAASTDLSTSALRFGVGSYEVVVTQDGLSAIRLRNTLSGTTTVFDNISVKEIPASAPYIHWLLYDGTDDSMQTSTIAWGTNEFVICGGLYKASYAASGMYAELSASVSTTNGSAYLANSGGTPSWSINSRGTLVAAAVGSTGAAPNTAVLTGQAKISTDYLNLRGNGASIGSSSSDQGTGNYGSHVLNFGRRNNASLPLIGSEYQTVIRSRLLSAAELSSLETFIAAKTGVIL